MSVFDRKYTTTLDLKTLFWLWNILSSANNDEVKRVRDKIFGSLQEVNSETTQSQPDRWQKFHDSVVKMNQTYDLPVNESPKLLPNQAIRTQQFMDILGKELAEGDDILTKLQAQETFNSEDTLYTLTALADWYGDMIVYIVSEAVRNGIPIMDVLGLVMDSNQTKLGEYGKPSKDENDKFLKGPFYIPPEPAIKKLLAKLRGNNVLADETDNINTFRDMLA